MVLLDGWSRSIGEPGARQHLGFGSDFRPANGSGDDAAHLGG